MRDKSTLSSVQNALQLLRLFTYEQPEQGVSQLSEKMGLAKSTVHRIIKTLCEAGYLTKTRSNRYRLGISLLEFSGIITEGLDLLRISVPYVEKIVEKVNESAHIAVLEDLGVIYLYKHECRHPIRLYTHIGKHHPIHATSSGKAILAFQPQETIQRVIRKGLKKYTNTTISDSEEFIEDLRHIKNQGYSTSDQELYEGVISIAAPIRDYTGHVIASVNIAGPIQRIQTKRINGIVRESIKAAQSISKDLGYV